MSTNRKPVFTFIDYSEDTEDDLNYCPKCERVNVKSRLGPRIYEDNKPLPYDYDQWMQCYRCGHIEPIYGVRDEPKYGPAVERPITPFDVVGSEFQSVKKRSSKKRVPRNKLHDEQDKDILQEMKGGKSVNIIQ